MAYKKRRKTTRFRGSHTHGRGFKKKARGSGHRGGFGMAGTGKRGDAKKTMILNLFGNDYFGKDRTLRRGTAPKKASVIKLENIETSMESLIKQGIAKAGKDGYELDLSKYKILGSLSQKTKLIIKAKAASEGAIASIKQAGGQITTAYAAEAAPKAEKKEEKKPAAKAAPKTK